MWETRLLNVRAAFRDAAGSELEAQDYAEAFRTFQAMASISS
jgi:hypothetical protein